MRKLTVKGVTGIGAMLWLAAPGAAQAPELAMLGQLEKGAWELRLRSDGSRERVCLRSGRELIQLRHRQPGCSQFVVEDGANAVTVQYTCPGNGYGRTTIRRESNSLVQVRSQGVLNGSPFSLDGEARRSGRC